MSPSQGKRRCARIDRLPPYVFNITAELKLAARRRGEDIIDMSMGNPDGATPPHIVAKLTEVAQRPDTHGYSASKGIPRLRRAISHWYKDRYAVDIDPDTEAIVTTDAAVGVLRTRLMEKARQLDPCLSIHDLRIVPGDTHTNVLFDLEFPAGYTGNKDEMLAAMCQFVHEQDPKYSCVVKVEQSYASAAHEK